MRFILIILFSTLFFFNFQAEDNFPVSNYSYAKVYLFNINWKNTSNRPDSHIYNGEYAKTKIGNGFDLNEEYLEQILRTINHFKNEMHIGLSKCFIPRHGIIFYNKKHLPVASISICFECERISTWDIDSSFNQSIKEINFSPKQITATEKGFSLLKRLFIKSKIPVYENTKQYYDNLISEEKIKAIPMKKMPFTSHSITLKNIINCNPGNKLSEGTETKITAGGEKYKFKTLTYKNSKFLFNSTEENPKLAEATIIDTGIKTILNLQIGMSLEEVNLQSNLELQNNYNQFKIDAEDIRLILTFKNKTLKTIQLIQY